MWWVWGSAALAWGPQAHERIAAQAEAALSPAARAALQQLTDAPLAELSVVLDARRRDPAWQWSRPLHFVNIDPHAAGFSPARDCPDQQCATAAVNHFTHRLATSTDPAVRREALTVVVHLVADLHQPLHVSYAADRGGNDHVVWYDGAPTDLHSLWDDVLPGRVGALPEVEGGGTPEDWAAESFAITRSLAYAVPPGTTVSAEYLDQVTPIAATRMAQASARLAETLEAALAGQAPDDPLPAGYRRLPNPLSDGAGRGAAAAVVLLVLARSGLLRWRAAQKDGATPGYRVLTDLLGMPGLLLGALAAVALTTTVDVVTPLAFQYGFDVILPAPTAARLGMLAVVLLSALLVSLAGWWMAASSLARLAARFQDQLRTRMLVSLQGASLRTVQKLGISDILTRFQGDLAQFDAFLLRELPRLFRSTVQAAALLVVMFSLEWRLTLATLLLMPAVAWLPRYMAGRASAARTTRQEAEAHAGEVIHELVSALPTLRAFGLEARWQERFQARTGVLTEAIRQQGWLSVMIPGAGFTAGQAMMVVVLLGGMVLAVQGEMSLGDIGAMFTALFLLAGAISRLTTSIPSTINALNAYTRIATLLDLPPVEAPQAAAAAPLTEALSLRQVVFSHTGQTLHLTGLDIDIQAGRSTAIVGPSGAGKSTLLWLLLRHADPLSGRILWDGAPLHTGHRAVIGLVPQHSPIFAMSVRENIRLGLLAADDAAVEEAARKAAVHEAILAMPEGYDTLLSADQGLSGGQRQRIAIARALLRAPSLLVLDEATSALDPATAARIRQTLDAARQTCTTLTITHDLASVRDHDHIVVLRDGAVADQGTHDALMSRSALYRSLVEQQSGFEVAAGGRQARVSVDRLARFSLFSRLPRPILARLAAAMGTETFADGAAVVRLGDPGDRMFLIARGRLIATVPGQGVVRTCDAGDHVGEIGMLSGRPRTATLTAAGFCVLLSIARDDFFAILHDAPALIEAVRQTARDRLEATRTN